MRIKYNFAFKDSKLSPWQRPAPPNILVTDASLQKKIIFLYKEFHRNAEIFYPSSLILIINSFVLLKSKLIRVHFFIFFDPAFPGII